VAHSGRLNKENLMRPKSERHAAVITATLAAFDEGTRGGDLITVAVDKIDEVRSAASLPSMDTGIITMALMGSTMGDDRDALERALHGFNTI
jgi:hypothetical protein